LPARGHATREKVLRSPRKLARIVGALRDASVSGRMRRCCGALAALEMCDAEGRGTARCVRDIKRDAKACRLVWLVGATTPKA
jgi:hypothetical protein